MKISRRTFIRATGISLALPRLETYAADPERVRGDLEAYGDTAVSVIVRPTTPDCESSDDVRAKVELARERGLRRTDFYHYGFMRLDALDWIRAAVST